MGNPKILLLGGVLLDRYYEVDRYPAAGQDTLIHRAFDVVGGCCLNVAATLKNLGNDPYIVSQYSDDEAGNKIISYVKSLGVSSACMIRNVTQQTGYCLNVLSGDGERTFFTYRGCEAIFPTSVLAQVQTMNFAIAFITGYYLLNPNTAEAVLQLAGELHRKKCQVIFDPGPLVGEIAIGVLLGILSGSDWLVPNASELAILQARLGGEKEIKDWYFAQGGRGIVEKKGSEGVEIFTPEDAFKRGGFNVNTQDTTGAGDSFVGGFIHGLVNGYPLPQAAAIASACGAITTTFKGPHGVFAMKDVMKLIELGEENDAG